MGGLDTIDTSDVLRFTATRARVAELVDARDLKSLDRKVVPVRSRPRAPKFREPSVPTQAHGGSLMPPDKKRGL